MTRTFKTMACAAAAAAILGGTLLGQPAAKADTVEACVIRAQEYAAEHALPASHGYCVIAGKNPSVTADAATAPSEREPAEIVRVAELHTEIPRILGALPLITGPAENAVMQTEAAPYTEEELELLACAIYQEAGGDACTDDTRRMVGEVVINRVSDPRFPDTIAGVLTQRGQYGLFWKTGVVWPARAAHEPEAVERAYDCARLVLSGERLLPEDVIFQAEFVQGEIVASAPGFYFCR